MTHKFKTFLRMRILVLRSACRLYCLLASTRLESETTKGKASNTIQLIACIVAQQTCVLLFNSHVYCRKQTHSLIRKTKSSPIELSLVKGSTKTEGKRPEIMEIHNWFVVASVYWSDFRLMSL